MAREQEQVGKKRRGWATVYEIHAIHTPSQSGLPIDSHRPNKQISKQTNNPPDWSKQHGSSRKFVSRVPLNPSLVFQLHDKPLLQRHKTHSQLYTPHTETERNAFHRCSDRGWSYCSAIQYLQRWRRDRQTRTATLPLYACNHGLGPSNVRRQSQAVCFFDRTTIGQ